MVKLKPKPINVILGFIFILALWLADVNILAQSVEGFFAKTHLTLSTKLPAFVLAFISILIMLTILFYFSMKHKNKNKENLFFAKLFILCNLIGLIFFIFGALFLVIQGHDSLIWNYSSIGLYHSSLPILVLSIIGYLMLE